MDAPPCDRDACKPGHKGPIANRLMSKEVAKKLRDGREAMRLANQTREDHAPFTLERNDHIPFLDQMKKNERENPETIEEAMNLMSIESRASGWALREPSLIPVWLHPRLGLPDRAIRASEDEPWYRKGSTPYAGVRTRPPPQKLPDYLQAAQDKINGILEFFTRAAMTPQH